MSRALRQALRAAAPLLLLAGCAALDPLTKEGVWRPVAANDTNLRAMIAVPSDLVQGRAARYSDGNQAAKAVARYREDRIYPVPVLSVSTVGGGGSSAPAPAAAP